MPHRPGLQILGDTPLILPDVSIAAIFLSLLSIALICHSIVFGRNVVAGKKFLATIAVIGTALAHVVRP